MQTIRVALGIIRQGDLYHLQLRNHKTSSGVSGMIGCFGGLIEEGEEPLQAISREINEETSLSTQTEDLTFIGEVKVTSEYRQDPVEMNGFVFSTEMTSQQKIEAKEGELVSLTLQQAAAKIDDMTPGTRATFEQYILKG